MQMTTKTPKKQPKKKQKVEAKEIKQSVEITASHHLAPFYFKPGQSGNPAGRPKGTRNQLTDAFVAIMCADFRENGKAVVDKVRSETPEAYLKVVASLVPKQVEVGEAGAFADLPEADLDRYIAEKTKQIALLDQGIITH